VLAHDAGGEVNQLVPVYPTDGIAEADHPFLLLRGSWVSADRAGRGGVRGLRPRPGRAGGVRAGRLPRSRPLGPGNPGKVFLAAMVNR
jgi:hypothetical protein